MMMNDLMTVPQVSKGRSRLSRRDFPSLVRRPVNDMTAAMSEARHRSDRGGEDDQATNKATGVVI
jgi:hypothetical protein